jgi:hypothetical protein
VVDQVDFVRAAFRKFRGFLFDAASQQHRAKFHPELGGELLPFAEQFEGDGLDLPLFLLAEHPDVLIFRQVLFSARGSLQLYRGEFAGRHACAAKGADAHIYNGFFVRHMNGAEWARLNAQCAARALIKKYGY